MEELRSPRAHVSRRASMALGAGLLAAWGAKPPNFIIVRVNVMLDQGAHSGKGLNAAQVAQFRRLHAIAEREFATSGIRFDVAYTEGAFLRTQGYSEIPDRFLRRNALNLFVTESLAYDIDRDRTGGCSIGPRPRTPKSASDPYYKTFLGLREASDTTLPHEYAHHLTLDTRHHPTGAGNVWADLRNDYYLWRQRHGVAIQAFRACAGSEWASVPVA